MENENSLAGNRSKFNSAMYSSPRASAFAKVLNSSWSTAFVLKCGNRIDSMLLTGQVFISLVSPHQPPYGVKRLANMQSVLLVTVSLGEIFAAPRLSKVCWRPTSLQAIDGVHFVFSG